MRLLTDNQIKLLAHAGFDVREPVKLKENVFYQELSRDKLNLTIYTNTRIDVGDSMLTIHGNSGGIIFIHESGDVSMYIH